MDGAIAIRFQIGQFDVTKADIDFAFNVMCEIAGWFDKVQKKSQLR